MKTRHLHFIIASLILLTDINAVTPEELFPEFNDWDLKIDETVYVPENLWELINGAAEAYLAYDFQDLHIGEYTNAKNDMIHVELYRHGDPENTFGIYSSERMPDYHFITAGTEGYTSFGALNFFTGNYYVKMLWSGASEADESLLMEFAGKIEDKLKQENRWPDILSYLPELNRIPKSEGYSNENFLGYSCFHSAFTAGYRIDNREFKLFIIQLNDSNEARLMLNEYFKTIHFNASGTKDQDHIVVDPFYGKMAIGTKDHFLFGVYNLDDEQLITQYLDQLRRNIRF
ncbi:MAG: hypothetical protein JW723_03050 [Bacteroidales bacterium]|nr:hypothetical protein [Bacteroidales bacterium]